MTIKEIDHAHDMQPHDLMFDELSPHQFVLTGIPINNGGVVCKFMCTCTDPDCDAIEIFIKSTGLTDDEITTLKETSEQKVVDSYFFTIDSEILEQS